MNAMPWRIVCVVWCIVATVTLTTAEPLAAFNDVGHDGLQRVVQQCPPVLTAATKGEQGNRGSSTGSTGTTTVAAFYNGRQEETHWPRATLEVGF